MLTRKDSIRKESVRIVDATRESMEKTEYSRNLNKFNAKQSSKTSLKEKSETVTNFLSQAYSSSDSNSQGEIRNKTPVDHFKT